MSTTTETSEKRNPPWFDQRIVDFGEVERAERHALAWRRATFASIALIFILGAMLALLSASQRTTVLVYAADKHGGLSYLGEAGQEQPPSLYGVEKDLSTWVSDFRSIPDHDPVLAQQNANVVFAMLAQGSSAANDALTFYKTYSPVNLNSKLGIHRSVSDVVVSQLTELSYSLTWTENFYSNDQLTTQHASATVTLAQPPGPPRDPTVAQINPNGILIRNYQGHWTDPEVQQ